MAQGSLSFELLGEVTGATDNTVLNNNAVTGKVLSGFSASPGTVLSTDTILEAFQKLQGSASANYILANGTIPLTANWDAGSFKIIALSFESDIATGTAPFIVASTTKVTNLNCDLLDDQTGSYYLDGVNFTGSQWEDLTNGTTTALHTHSHVDLGDIGSNSHTDIDTHITDTTIHYVQGAISHLNITNIGTNTHAQIDLHLASTSNPHTVSFSQAVSADVGTDITSAEAETLTDGSNADALHIHAVSDVLDVQNIDNTDSPYTPATTHQITTIFCDTSSGDITITLPSVSSAGQIMYNIKKIDNSNNTITIDPNGSETIEGETDSIIKQKGTSFSIQNDGTEWWII